MTDNDFSVIKITENMAIIDEMRRNDTGRLSAKEVNALDWAKACMAVRLDWYEKESNRKGETMCKICKPSPKDESWDWDMEQDAREYLDSLVREEGKETGDGE